eukprot:TRINITY_DN2166_c0_g1_i1.p1 TRINITY_DN2166_c0_g1~~TRINITY_DN2166_c0_g1_i1.p1  ORF type:complete len:848 (+),score=191.20 TRINITY_DN2166_c0_g1_i1:2332-4875(+)
MDQVVRVYVHYEACELTLRFDLATKTLVSEVLDDVKKKGDITKGLELKTEKGTVLALTADVREACSDSDDLFAVIKVEAPVAVGKVDTSVAVASPAVAKAPKNQATELEFILNIIGNDEYRLKIKSSECKLTSSMTIADAQARFLTIYKSYVNESSTYTLCRKKNSPPLDSNDFLWDHVASGKLYLVPKKEPKEEPSNTDNEGVAVTGAEEKELELLKKYLGMGQEALDKGAYARAIEVYSKLQGAVNREPESAKGLAIAYGKARRWKEAVQSWKHVLDLTGTDDLTVIRNYGEALVKAGEYEEAIQVLVKVADTKEPVGHDLKCLLGNAFYGKADEESRNTAAALWTAVLKDTNQTHVESMVGYTTLMQEVGQDTTAIRGLLNVLVANTTNTEVKEAFGTVMRKVPNSAEILKEVVPVKADEGGASALGFLSTVMKDNGAVEQSIKILEECRDMCPSTPTYTLNLVHSMSVLGQYWEGLETINAFFKRCPDLGVKTKDGHSVKCSEFIPVLSEVLEKKDKHDFLCGKAAQQWADSGSRLRWVKDGAVITTDASVQPAVSNSVPSTPGGSSTSCEFSSEEIDLLAVWFACVKMLFVQGCLSVLPAMVARLDPLRKGRDLHLTIIRNEQAYFCAIEHLMQYLSLPVPVTNETLYVCGDSHSLTPSWHTVNIDSKTHVMQNCLVTGLKCWHLRPESHFYPKYNFEAMTNQIPKGSTVMMIFGEIDCREGILFAVEKGRYSSVEEGMKETIDIYIKALVRLQQQHDFKVLVHPALPMLDVTRHLVCQFNDLLQAALQDKRVIANGNIYWLDFYKSLLSDDCKELKPEYQLDGTHCNPKYLEHMQVAIDAL